MNVLDYFLLLLSDNSFQLPLVFAIQQFRFILSERIQRTEFLHVVLPTTPKANMEAISGAIWPGLFILHLSHGPWMESVCAALWNRVGSCLICYVSVEKLIQQDPLKAFLF